MQPLLHADEAAHFHADKLVAGVDEAGRGCWAGDVVAACVAIPLQIIAESPEWLTYIADSKQLKPAMRAQLYTAITTHCYVGVGAGSLADIENLNIRGATLLAMQRAVSALAHTTPQIQHYYIDGRDVPPDILPANAVVKGDSTHLCVSAASIVAKHSRDMQMLQAEDAHPHYGFAKHKGYGTAQHAEALRAYGVCPLHRRGFRPIAQMLT